MKSRLIILLYATVCIYIVFNLNKWRSNEVVQWDKAGYYLYLPAIFIEKDLGHLSFYPNVASTYNPHPGVVWYAITEIPETGRKLDKYPIGVSIFETPFFFIAHAYTLLTHQFKADGYTPPYMLAICLATIFWVTLGLWLLRKFLLNYYSENVTFVAILFISFGTNLYNYTGFDWGMSHSFSFFLFAALLYYTHQWYSKGSLKYIALLGLVMGMIVITRPTNILVGIVCLLWPVNRNAFSNKLTFFKKQVTGIVVAAAIFLLVVLLQLAYWKYITGHWAYYTYTNEGFDFGSPHIWDGLFSYRKGWFVYTPLALVGMLGFIPLFRKQRRLFYPLLLFFLLDIYIIFSWHEWNYGGSFGCRPLVETLAFLSIPLSAFIAYLLSIRQKIWRVVTLSVLFFLVVVNIFQTYQFLQGTIPSDRMNGKYYWSIWGKIRASDDDWKKLSE